jgi:hypothetical protein
MKATSDYHLVMQDRRLMTSETWPAVQAVSAVNTYGKKTCVYVWFGCAGESVSLVTYGWLNYWFSIHGRSIDFSVSPRQVFSEKPAITYAVATVGCLHRGKEAGM